MFTVPGITHSSVITEKVCHCSSASVTRYRSTVAPIGLALTVRGGHPAYTLDITFQKYLDTLTTFFHMVKEGYKNTRKTAYS